MNRFFNKLLLITFFIIVILHITHISSFAMEEDYENEQVHKAFVTKKEVEREQKLTTNSSSKPCHWGLKNWVDNIVKYTKIAICCESHDLIDCCGFNSSCFIGHCSRDFGCSAWLEDFTDNCDNQNNRCANKTILCPCYAACHILCLPGAFCTYKKPPEGLDDGSTCSRVIYTVCCYNCYCLP
jgi:hypothetical protein